MDGFSYTKLDNGDIRFQYYNAWTITTGIDALEVLNIVGEWMEDVMAGKVKESDMKNLMDRFPKPPLERFLEGVKQYEAYCKEKGIAIEDERKVKRYER